MDSVSIGLQVSLGMLVMVVLGMRVAFAAGLAGLVGLVWLRWNAFDYDPAQFWRAVQISVKVAGLTPHSKVSAQVLSLIPVFILIGYLAYYARLTSVIRGGETLDCMGSRRSCGIDSFCHSGLRCSFWRLRRDCGGFCTYRDPRDA